jgi:AraC family transcriptional regulator, regulatory protein of adaptative response / methylated-DNA-[protein]-cysteine methyltransferase
MQIQHVCEFIRSHAAEKLSLRGLAAKAGLSPYHFHRTFKAQTGVTPRQFAESCRLEVLKSALRGRPSVTDAVYEAGFGSGSRVYEHSDRDLGMTPAQYRDGGGGVSISYASVSLALGRMMLAATDRGLCFLQFADSDRELLALLRAEFPEARFEKMRAPYGGPFDQWMQALREHVSGRGQSLNLPLDLRASVFQMQVWNYLRTIPVGSVRSYSEVAAGIGRPGAARAVARACAANRVALVIPCHRVIRGNGELGGYRWGVERKRALLKKEERS